MPLCLEGPPRLGIITCGGSPLVLYFINISALAGILL